MITTSPEIYRTGVPIVIDFETTTINGGVPVIPENKLLLACWQVGDEPIKSHWGSEFEQEELLHDIARADFIVAHNAKFELGWLARCGLDLAEVVVYDTMLGDYVLGGNRWVGRQLSLSNCLDRHQLGGKLDLVSALIREASVSTTEIPELWLETYCQQDVRQTRLLFLTQMEKLTGPLLRVMLSRCLLTPVLADVWFNGMMLDAPNVYVLHAEQQDRLLRRGQTLSRLTGDVNLASPIQIAEVIYEDLGFDERVVRKGAKWVPDRTPAGRRKADESTIRNLVADTDKQRAFKETYLEYRDAYGQVTKYLEKFVQAVEDPTWKGRLIANLNQQTTQTHRLSSTGLNYSCQFQNFPRGYKRLFKPSRAGWLMVEGDAAQLEFRIAGHLGKDEQVLQDSRSGFDVHANTARVLTEAGQPTSRQDAKTRTFKPLYGGSKGTKAEEAYFAEFKRRYAGVARAQQEWIDEVVRNGYLDTEWGLRFYWPDTAMEPSGYVRNSTAICNYPVQSFATAELVPLALVWFWHRILECGKRDSVVVVNTIHDSIIVECHPDELEWVKEELISALTYGARTLIRIIYGIELLCTLGAEVKAGYHWGSGELLEVKRDEEVSNG